MTISNCPRGSRSAPWATCSTGIIDDESYDHVGFEEKIKLMPDAETEARGARKIARLIRQARFKYKDACVEDIENPTRTQARPRQDRTPRLLPVGA